MVKTCDYCGDKFETNRSTQRFCSECTKIKNIGRKTDYLNNDIRIKTSIYKDYLKGYEFKCEQCKKKFMADASLFNAPVKLCSMECRKQWKIDNKEYIDSHTYTCKYCGNKIVDYRRTREFCGDNCRKAYKERNVRTANCLNCGKKFKFNALRPKYFCSDECRLTVALHDVRYLNNSETLYQCQYCGKTFIGNKNKERKFCSKKCSSIVQHSKN